LVHLKEDEALVDLYKQSLVDFTTRKNSALNSHFFQDFIRRYPSQAWRLREDLLDLCRKSVNTYRQAQIVHLIELLVSLLPAMSEQNREAIKFMPLLKELLLELANNSCDEKAELSVAQMKELFKLASLAVRQTKRLSPATTQSIWEPKAWKILEQKLKTCRFQTSPALPKMSEQVARMSEVSSGKDTSRQVTSKRKVGEVNGTDVEPQVPKPSKRKKVKGDKVNHD